MAREEDRDELVPHLLVGDVTAVVEARFEQQREQVVGPLHHGLSRGDQAIDEVIDLRHGRPVRATARRLQPVRQAEHGVALQVPHAAQ